MQNVAMYFDGCERGGGGFLHQKPPLPAPMRQATPLARSAKVLSVVMLAVLVTAGFGVVAPEQAQAATATAASYVTPLVPQSINDFLVWVANEVLRLKTR